RADIVVVGAGLFGLTIAERCATEMGLRVAVLEKRAHLGGNVFSEADGATGIEVHRYGSHIFHTSNERVWAYANRFTSFNDYQHRVFSVSDGRVYPMPINLATMCQHFGRPISPQEARRLIAEQSAEVTGPDSLETKAISMIGRPLYETLIRGYSVKQWQADPKALPAATIGRLPVRYTFDNRYFDDIYQGVRLHGYTAWVERLVDHRRIVARLAS